MTLGVRPSAAARAAVACAIPLLVAFHVPVEKATAFELPGWLTGDAWDVEKVAALPPSSDPYLAALQVGYVALARNEIEEGDWMDGAFFLDRARSAAADEDVPPIDLEERSLPDPAFKELETARAELTALRLASGPRKRAGRQIGEAQIEFDCWVQEAEEDHQFDQIDSCREKYLALFQLARDVGSLPDNLAVVLPDEEGGEIGGIVIAGSSGSVTLDQPFSAAATSGEVGDVPVDEGEIRDAFAGALAARPAPPVQYSMVFEFGIAEVNDDAFDVILDIVDEARKRPAVEVLVTGFADAPGSNQSNLALSRRRAENVRRVIEIELRETERADYFVRAKGEADLLIETLAPEERNRRVVVVVR